MSTLVIRADANPQMGTGHVMRCLALAQAWQERGGEIAFVTATGTPALEERLAAEGMEIFKISATPGSLDDAVETADFARKVAANWVMVDGYHFDSTYQRKVKEAGHRLMIIDDMAHHRHYYADIVMNQNIHAKDLQYPCEPYTKLLLGTKYVLLRREFVRWGNRNRQILDVASKVLLTLGGSDPDNVTLKVIHAIRKISITDLEVRIVVGPSNLHEKSLKDAVLFAPCPMRILENVNNMPELMAWADMAVSAGGSTCWEMAFMGLPNVIVFSAENQRPVAENLDQKGIALNLGSHETIEVDLIALALEKLILGRQLRAEMSGRGQELVDGEGVERVLMCLSGEKIRLRELRREDCRLIWEWANDPETRRVSFSSGFIPWEEHVKWFESRLNNSNCLFYIPVDHDDIPIGQVRFDVENQEAVISVNLDKKFRRKGYGNRLIYLSSKKLFENSNVMIVHAYIKTGNEMSTRAFLKAGFLNKGIIKVKDHQAIHLVVQKPDLA